MEKIFLSVIIATKNRTNMLKPALESIAKQNLSQQFFETIVVDNDSADETKDVVDSFVKNMGQSEFVKENNVRN